MNAPSESSTPRERGRVRRALASIAATLGLSAVFVGSLVGGALLHLDLPPARRNIERFVRAALDGVFEGSIDAQGIAYAGLDGVAIDSVVIRDPSGAEVIRARGVRGSASVLTIVRSALGSGDLVVTLNSAHIDQADVLIEPNAQGEISIAAAMSPRVTAEAGPGRPVRFKIEKIEIDAATAHGKPDGVHPLDGEVHGLRGSLSVVPGSVTLDVEKANVAERALAPVELAGLADYHLRLSGPASDGDTTTPEKSRMWASFAGRAGKVELVAQALLEGDHVELSADAPKVHPEHMKELFKDYSVSDVVTAHIDAKGELPNLDFRVSAETEHRGSVSVEGRAELGKTVRADMTVRADALDLRAVVATLPQVRITANAKVHAEVGEQVTLRADVHSEPTQLGETAIPGIDATATFDGRTLSGSATVHEPGAPIEATFGVGEDGTIRFDATTKIASLAKVPRIPAKLGGAGTLRATGTVQGDRLDATVRGTVRGFHTGPKLRVGRATVAGRIHGPFTALRLDGTVSAGGVEAEGYSVSEAQVRVQGPIEEPRLETHIVAENDIVIDASGAVDPATGSARSVKVRVERGGTALTGTIARIGPKGSGVGLDGMSFDSPELGKIAGSLRVIGGELSGKLHADGVDLQALRTMLGMTRPMSGTVSADIALNPVRGGRTGTVQVSLKDGSMEDVHGITANVSAAFDKDRVSANGDIAMQGSGERCGRTIGKVSISGGEGRIAGPLLAERTWRGVTGRVNVAADDLDLECLAPLSPVELPVSEIFGQVSAKLAVVRDKPVGLPSIRDLWARTFYLTVVGPKAKPEQITQPDDAPTKPVDKVKQPEPPAPWATRDIDVVLRGDIDGETGETTLSAELDDQERLADVALATRLDFAALLDPERRAAALRRMPVAGMVNVAVRPIASYRSLPSFMADKIPALSGDAGVELYVNGSIDQPTTVVRLTGRGLTLPPSDSGERAPWTLPIDVDAAAWYLGGKTLGLDAWIKHDRQHLARAEVDAQLPIARLLADEDIPRALTGRAGVTLLELPLAHVPALGDRNVGGHVSGKIALDGVGTDPALSVDLRTSDLTVGQDLAFREGHVQLAMKRAAGAPATTATASVHLVDDSGGGVDASAHADVAWQEGVGPTLLQSRPAEAQASFTKLRLALIEPLLGGSLRKVDGFLDGEVTAGWARGGPTEEPALEADLRLTGATFYIPRMGQELRLSGASDWPLHLVAERGGAVRIDPFDAKANTGRARIEASGKLDGLTLQSATAKVTIREKESVPVTIEGVEIGETWGALEIGAKMQDSLLALDVSSKDLHLKIPSSSTRDVQSLDENADVHLSHVLKPPSEAPTKSGFGLSITARLENAVIEGKGIHIALSSAAATPPVIELTDKLRASGDVRMVSGAVEVMGRKFVLEQGAVHLRPEEASNPYLNVTAHWDAPDGSRIFVDYVGVLSPITRNKLRFRSNPPRTQQEAMAMLLFGSETGGALTTGGGGSFSSTATGAAVDLGGELAAQQFNQLLSGIAPLKGLSTRFGTAENGGLKTSLVYQVGDTVSAVATYEGGALASGSGTDTSVSGNSSSDQGASLSVDWRFVKNWLIRATVGTNANIPKGEVDLLWQYRY